MTTVTSKLMTADDLLAMPDDHQRHELISGELTTMAPSGSEHGAVTINLTAPLAAHVKNMALGRLFGAETGFIIARNPDTVRAPDIAFISTAKLPKGRLTEKFWPGVPDLAVEVVSPSDKLHDVDEKVMQWLAAGCALVWVVNPKRRTVTVNHPDGSQVILTERDSLSGDAVVPGFTMPIAELFT